MDKKSLQILKKCSKRTRYINLREMSKRNKQLNYAIFSYSARDFRQVTRMDEASWFKLLHDAIKDDPVFHKASQNKQTAVWIQLLVTLQVIGLEGNGAQLVEMLEMLTLVVGELLNLNSVVIKRF